MTYTAMFAQLVRAEIELWNSLDRHLLATVQLTLPTVQALTAIDGLSAHARVQDVSDAMSITVGATSKLVDRLERDGLVTRESNPHDRRSSLVVLTPSGQQSLATGQAAAEAHLEQLLGGSYSLQQAASIGAELSALRTHISNGVPA